MDRARLKSWLNSSSKTWRWNHGDYGEYDAVEASPDGLTWYRWSHDIALGGKTEVVVQSLSDFRERGPAKSVPKSVLRLLSSWIEESK